MSMTPYATLLNKGRRLHLQHGPIDLIVAVDAATLADRRHGFGAAISRFATVLDELVSELSLLRREVNVTSVLPKGDIARRMDRAVRPFAPRFITPMAAVAGAVADEVLAAIVAQTPLWRAYVNNGGDIALHLAPGTEYAAAIAGLDGADHGRIRIGADTAIRGVATSGSGGRSLSFGIADSVSVLASSAAQADAAATLIANAVDLPGHGSITRQPARDLDPDSDLGARLVVTGVGPLSAAEIDKALNAGAAAAQTMLGQGRILGAALFLRGARRLAGALPQIPAPTQGMLTHA